MATEAPTEAIPETNVKTTSVSDVAPAEAVKDLETSAVSENPEANGDKLDTDKTNEDRNGNERVVYSKRGDHIERYGSRDSKRHNRKNTSNEFADLPETDDPAEIRKQVEFYFSTQNLSTDKHMFFEIQGPDNTPMPLKHLHTFKRMRRFQPYSAIVAALRDSTTLDIIDDGDFNGAGNEAVKRKQPIVAPKRSQDEDEKPTLGEIYHRLYNQSRNALDASIYAKNFGDEDQAGQIALENFFSPYGAIMVRKRRNEDEGSWKGSVFVEFESEEQAKEFLELDPKPKYNGNELTIMSKKAYSEMKCKEKGITPAWERGGRNERGDRGGHRGHRGHRGGRGGRGGGRGRGHARHDRHDRRDRRDRDGNGRNRSRSPRERRERRDRSRSRGSVDRDDWNKRRDRFQADGDKSSKRKADDNIRENDPKKSKIEIKEDA